MMTCVLKDLIEISKGGEWGKGEPSEDSVEMLCIRGTDFADVRFGNANSTPHRHIAKRISERKMLQPWDLLIEAAGGTKNQITGRTVLLRPQLFSGSEFPVTCASFSRFIRFKTDLRIPRPNSPSNSAAIRDPSPATMERQVRYQANACSECVS